jgi:hypothetical protein
VSAEAVELLRKARALIEDPDRWGKGWYCIDAEGRRLHDDEDPPGCKRCMAGALRYAAGIRMELDYPPGNNTAALAAATRAARRVIKTLSPYESISDFNDDETTTHADVLKVVDLAIEAES